jgi:RNA polymerase primary sigma factor
MNFESFSGLSLYMDDVNVVPLLTRKEEQELGRKAFKGDQEAIERLVVSNLRLVVKIAHDFKGFGVPISDLIAEGNIGLLKAAGKYDPDRGTKFSSYSAIWIKQAIRLALAKLSRTVRIPVSSLSKISKIHNANIKLKELLNREPTDEEIAKYLQVPLLTVKHLRGVKVHNVSLQEKLNNDDMSGELQDQLADPSTKYVSDAMEANDILGAMKKYFDHLKDREQLILNLRFGLMGQPPRTLEEVSKAVNLTRERVRQIQIAALGKLRTKMKLDSTLGLD